MSQMALKLDSALSGEASVGGVVIMGSGFGRKGFHVVFHRAEHREQVLGGDVALDVVNAVENKAAALAENFDAFADFTINLVGRAERQGLLRVHTTAPEHDVPAELALESARVHARGGALHGIQHVEARRDE